MPKYTGPDADQLMLLLDPPVKRALKLIDWVSDPKHDQGWPYKKTDDKYTITAVHRPLMNQYVIDWQPVPPSPASPRSRLIARLLGITVGDQLTLMPNRSVSALDIDNSELKCRVIYWSGAYKGAISIPGRANKVTPRDVIKYLERHPLPPIPTGKG